MFRFYATDLPRLWAMALTLEDVLSRNGVDSNLSNGLMMEGWNLQTFRMAAVDLHGLKMSFPNDRALMA